VGLRLPFSEGAVQFAGDGSPDLRHLHTLVVQRIKEVGGKVLPRARWLPNGIMARAPSSS